MSENLMQVVQFVGVMLVVTAGVWGAAESLGRSLPGRKIHYALLFGPLAAATAHGAGFLPTPVEGGWSWGFVAVMGLLATLGAKQFNDRINPLRKRR